MTNTHEGSCLCGAVRYTTDGPLSDVVACHCSQCRKQTGHYFASTNVADDNLAISGAEHLEWYRATPEARRAFCRTCGSTLFWKHDNDPFTAILAGSLDGKTGLALKKHIFCADKGDYYDIDDGLPQTP